MEVKKMTYEEQIILEPQEYLVKDGYKVQDFSIGMLGLDAEADKDYCTVFELTGMEHKLIREFIDKNKLWSE